MQLHQIRHFVAVADCGSIRAAARRLQASQPALTKSLHGLEAELGVPLLQRHARGVTLTEGGRLLLTRARTVQAELQRAQQDLSALAGRASGQVAVGVASVIGALVVPGALLRLGERHPEIAIRVVEGVQESLLPQLREGVIELAACLWRSGESTAGFTVRPLARVQMVVAARRGHPLRHARTLAELQHAAWIAMRPRGGGGLLEHAYRMEGLEPPPARLYCESLGLQLPILAGSDTLALMARPMLSQPMVSGLLEEIPLRRPLPLLTMGLYRRSDAPLSKAGSEVAAVVAQQTRRALRMP